MLYSEIHDLDETMTMWTDSETMKCFSKTCFIVIAANCENSSESDKLLVNEWDGECHMAVVSDSEVHNADQVSEQSCEH